MKTIKRVPEDVMNWLVAQGYVVTGVSEDATTTPPTKYFDLER